MPQRFGQANDYSQNFAYLARENQVRMEQAADRIDRQREEELAAEDELMFTKYQEGKVSGQEILAYIEKRVRETGYDKAQQDKWRSVLVEYRNNVMDERATAEYERTGNMGAFIAHWSKRLEGTKKGTPERTQIQRILTQLREERDNKQLTRGAQRIMREITKGKKSTKDLISYYKDAIASGKYDKDTMSRLRDTVAELQAKHRAEQYQVANNAIDQKLASGEITPQEAARQKESNASKFGLQRTDPVGYSQLQNEIRVLNASPDPVEVQKWQNRLQSGDVTPEQYAKKMNQWADQIAPYDQKAAWELRGAAQKMIDDYQAEQALPGGSIIGNAPEGNGRDDKYGGPTAVVGNFVRNRDKIAHITQLDGGTYSMLNCTMASAAMMGHSMGVEGLTGSDLRALTNDAEGGTTLLQAKYALEQSGVYGLRYKDNYDYNKFLINIKQGSTAMLSGYLGNMGGSGLNNGGAQYNHNIYIVKYDPKRGFLALDPAKSNDKGTWLSESQIKAFAWTGNVGSYSRNGSVMFSPKGTLATRWNKGKSYDPRKTKAYSQRVSRNRAQQERTKAGAMYGGEIEAGITHISVDAPAKTPQGEQYEGQFAAGISTKDVAAAVQATDESYQTPEHKERLRRAGITYGSASLDTRDEVQAEVDTRQRAVQNLRAWIDGFEQGYDGSDGPVRVVVGSETRYLTLEEVSQLERDLVLNIDGIAMLQHALGNTQMEAEARKWMNEVILQSQNLTSTSAEWEANRLANNVIARLEAANGPEEIRAVLDEVESDISQFIDNYTEEAGYDPTTGTVTLPEGEVTENTEQDVAVNQIGDLPLEEALGGREGIDVGVGGIASLDQLMQLLDEPTATPEQLLQVVAALVEQGAIAEGSPLHIMATQVAGQQGSLNLLDSGQGVVVILNGEQAVVPLENFAGANATGDRAEGMQVQEGVPTEEGPMDIGVGTGAQQVLDLDYLKEVYGVEIPPEYTLTGDGLPRAFIMLDGEAQSVFVVPQQIAYGGGEGPFFLRIQDLEQLQSYFEEKGLDSTHLVEGGTLTNDDLGQFTDREIALMTGEGGMLAQEPIMVNAMQLPDDSHMWFEDPETGLWHQDGLPHIGNGSFTLPGAAEGKAVHYVGGVPGLGGITVVDSSGYDAESNGTTGVPTPYGAGVEPTHAEILQGAGEGNEDSGERRDPLDGALRPATENEVSSAYTGMAAARDIAEKAAQDARDYVSAAWEAIKNPPQAGGADAMDSGLGIGLGSVSGGLGGPGLDMVGATDSRSQQAKGPGFNPLSPLTDMLDPNVWEKRIGDAVSGIRDKWATAQIPKLDWKPATEVAGGYTKSEQGYQKVERGGYDWEGGESYSPPKPTEPELPTPDRRGGR